MPTGTATSPGWRIAPSASTKPTSGSHQCTPDLKALSFGEPLVFKINKGHGHAVVGFGLFTSFDRLFDCGYITFTPDYELRVSLRLREDYDNGKVYYQHDGQIIWTPGAPYPKPDPERLKLQATNRFSDS